MNNNLKPCPFCGSESAICIIKENDEYVVCCDYSQGGCGATAGYRESIKEAKAIWNTRTSFSKEELLEIKR